MSRLASAFSPVRGWRRLWRAPAGAEHERALDGVRALAILWVVALHSVIGLVIVLPKELFLAELARYGRVSWLRWVVHGDLGVDLFFVLSGYLISSLLLAEQARAGGRLRVGRFYWRRFARLMPVYWLVLVLYCLAGFHNPRSVWANLLYINNYLPSIEQCMEWAWSLAVEEQFYLVFPLFLLLMARLPARARLPLLLAILVAALVTRALVIHHHGCRPFPLDSDIPLARAQLDLYYTKTHTRFGALVLGVIAAYLWRDDAVRRRLQSSAWISLALTAYAALVIVASVFFHENAPGLPDAVRFAHLAFNQYAFASAAAALLLVVVSRGSSVGRALARLLSTRALYPIAQLSYASYLVHLIAIGALYTVLRLERPPGAWMLLLYPANLALTLLLALVLYLFVERPILELRDTTAG
jgi:peptidoglycan/LPS O-acetylase OafA/YrhL